MVRLVDLHCHILPDIDDGPVEPDSALELVLGLEDLGFTDFYPTPHQKSGAWTPSGDECAIAATSLRTLLSEHHSNVVIHPPAGENMWDDLFLERQEDASFPTYPGGRAFLLEFPPDGLPPNLRELLFRFHVSGRLPVIAHIERYPFAHEPDRLELLGKSAALLVNLTAVGGGAGFWAKRLTRKLVRKQLVHAVATDAHSSHDVPACRAGLAWLQSKLGESAVQKLLHDHPIQIVSGEIPEW
jgi:protein-tyrosine phosphatase